MEDEYRWRRYLEKKSSDEKSIYYEWIYSNKIWIKKNCVWRIPYSVLWIRQTATTQKPRAHVILRQILLVSCVSSIHVHKHTNTNTDFRFLCSPLCLACDKKKNGLFFSSKVYTVQCTLHTLQTPKRNHFQIL